MRTYKIPVEWQMIGIIEVEAESLGKATQKINDMALPTDGSYVEDSFAVQYDFIGDYNPDMEEEVEEQ